MGTAGSISLIDKFNSNNYLITNADVITNIDFEKMYNSHIQNNSDLTIASNQYQVSIPFAVFEMNNNRVISSVEKPIKSYNTNAGIYLVNSNMIKTIPKKFYNMTDLIDDLIDKKATVCTYNIEGYWIDIGRPDDFEKANKFLTVIKFYNMINNIKLIELIKDIFEDIDTSNFDLETEFKNNDEWDSMTALTLITVIDQEFGISISGEKIKEFDTIKDILDFLNG